MGEACRREAAGWATWVVGDGLASLPCTPISTLPIASSLAAAEDQACPAADPSTAATILMPVNGDLSDSAADTTVPLGHLHKAAASSNDSKSAVGVEKKKIAETWDRSGCRAADREAAVGKEMAADLDRSGGRAADRGVAADKETAVGTEAVADSDRSGCRATNKEMMIDKEEAADSDRGGCRLADKSLSAAVEALTAVLSTVGLRAPAARPGPRPAHPPP